MAAGSAVLLAIVLLSLFLVSATRESARHVEESRDVRITASTILNDLVDAETGQRGYLLTARDIYLAPYEATRAHLHESIVALRERARRVPEIQPDADRIEALATAKMDELSNTIRTFQEGRRDEAIAMVQTDSGKQTMDEARVVLDKIIGAMNARMRDSLDGLQTSASLLAIATTVGGILIALFSVAASILVARSMSSLASAQDEVMALNQSLEARVADRTTELSRANDEIQRFAYIVSHDLRAPLVNIMGFTSELEIATSNLKTYFQSDEPNEEQSEGANRAATEEIPEAVHFIRASTSKMDSLIGAILKLSREGRRDMKRERVSLDDLVQTAAATLQHQLDNAEAHIDVPNQLPSVVGDRLALEQVFGNLLENAVKYLKPGRPGVIEVTGLESGGRVKISIADNGRGIEEKDRERIFELFRRAGTQDRPGEGVGLAHVRALVRRMGGDVTVTSTPGEGSTFVVDLPKKARLEAPSEDQT